MIERKGRAGTWIENNLWAILCAIAAAFSGYLTGMTTTTMRLDALEARSAKLERDLGHMRESDAAQVRNLDRINDKLDIEPPQPLEVTK
jgi:hypothetical protein